MNKALHHLIQSVAFFYDLFGHERYNSSLVCTAQMDLGVQLLANRSYEEALRVLWTALHIQLRLRNKKSCTIRKLYHFLAVAYRHLGHLDLARVCESKK